MIHLHLNNLKEITQTKQNRAKLNQETSWGQKTDPEPTQNQDAVKQAYLTLGQSSHTCCCII